MVSRGRSRARLWYQDVGLELGYGIKREVNESGQGRWKSGKINVDGGQGRSRGIDSVPKETHPSC